MRVERWLVTIPLKLRSLFRRRQLDQELDDEVRYHLEQKVDAYVAGGMTPEEARLAALRAFGGVEYRKEELRDRRRVWGLTLVEDLLADVRYAARTAIRTPGFTLVAILSLAIGIGANTAMFSLVDRFVLKTIPIEDPWRVVQVNRTGPGGQGPVLSYPTYQFLRDHNAVFTDMAATGRIWRLSVTVPPAQEPEPVALELVSGNYFSVLGVRPWMGRTLNPDDNLAAGVGGAQGVVAVVSHDYWQRRFAADGYAVLGRTFALAGTSVTIVGVADPRFPGIEVADPVDIWVPIVMQPRILQGQNWLDQPGNNWLRALGRLKPNVSREQARTATNLVFTQLPNAQGQRKRSTNRVLSEA